jgi:hypothetical protein
MAYVGGIEMNEGPRLGILVAALLAGGQSDSPSQIARTVRVETPTVAQNLLLLHMDKRLVYLHLVHQIDQAQVHIAVYHRGARVGADIEFPALHDSFGSGRDRATVCLESADLDYLALGDGKKRHCRVLARLELGSSISESTVDVAKEQFNFSRVTGGGAFAPTAGSDHEIPLFWLVANSTKVTVATTVEKVVKENSEGDVAIVYLHAGK